MKRIILLLTVTAMMAVILVVAATPAFAAKGIGGGYGWGVNDCFPELYDFGGPGCGYHKGQR